MNGDPTRTLRQGVALLEPVLVPYGFAFAFRQEGQGSGGGFAWGEFIRDDRRLELHYRHALGIVVYHVGDLWIDHKAYIRALGVPSGANQYPGFSQNPTDSFRHLAHDLARYAGDFREGDASVLRTAAPLELVRRAAEAHVISARYEGDEQKRRDARAHFRRGAFAQVIALLEDVHYPDLLHESERQMLEIARARQS